MTAADVQIWASITLFCVVGLAIVLILLAGLGK